MAMLLPPRVSVTPLESRVTELLLASEIVMVP
jgi:hypothetical protein